MISIEAQQIEHLFGIKPSKARPRIAWPVWQPWPPPGSYAKPWKPSWKLQPPTLLDILDDVEENAAPNELLDAVEGAAREALLEAKREADRLKKAAQEAEANASGETVDPHALADATKVHERALEGMREMRS